MDDTGVSRGEVNGAAGDTALVVHLVCCLCCSKSSRARCFWGMESIGRARKPKDPVTGGVGEL